MTRADQIAEAGLAVYKAAGEPANQPLIYALAAMLDAAVARPKGAPKPAEEFVPSVNPALFMALLRDITPDKVLCEGIDPSTYGVIGKKLTKMGVTEADLPIFENWLRRGGLDWIKDAFTWNQVCRAPTFRLLDWVTRARAFASPPSKVASQLEFNFKDLAR